MTDLTLWLALGAIYLGWAAFFAWETHLHNRRLPSFIDPVNPWLRGGLWLPIYTVAICMILLDALYLMAGGAFKRRR